MILVYDFLKSQVMSAGFSGVGRRLKVSGMLSTGLEIKKVDLCQSRLLLRWVPLGR